MNFLEIRLRRAFADRFVLIAMMLIVAKPLLAADLLPPAVGDEAPEFSLKSMEGTSIKRSVLNQKGAVVLVVLRGYPGYQCPLCSRQVGELLKRAKDFKDADARVVLVYPGPSERLLDRAKEFMGTRTIPDHFSLVLDPDYKFTNDYHLRWDAPGETAYPSAFVIGQDGRVQFALVSKTHGGRAKATDLLKVLAANK